MRDKDNKRQLTLDDAVLWLIVGGLCGHVLAMIVDVIPNNREIRENHEQRIHAIELAAGAARKDANEPAQ